MWVSQLAALIRGGPSPPEASARLMPSSVRQNDGATGGVDAAGEGGVGHDTAVPDAGDQVVLADHALAVADQEQQQVEDLRLDRLELALAAQLTSVGVENVVFEEKQQVCAPQCTARRGAEP
jgi:hypothetical protein